MKKTVILMHFALLLFATSCGEAPKENSSATPAEEPKSMVEDAPTYDPHRGEGKWTAENAGITATLNSEKATAGETATNVKCSSCHKMTDEKLVGPGWKGVTNRRTAEWILNFITNPDPMIDKDPEAQAMLELCLVRMPNQNLTDEEALNIFEYMRKNDGVK